MPARNSAGGPISLFRLSLSLSLSRYRCTPVYIEAAPHLAQLHFAVYWRIKFCSLSQTPRLFKRRNEAATNDTANTTPPGRSPRKRKGSAAHLLSPRQFMIHPSSTNGSARSTTVPSKPPPKKKIVLFPCLSLLIQMVIIIIKKKTQLDLYNLFKASSLHAGASASLEQR